MPVHVARRVTSQAILPSGVPRGRPRRAAVTRACGLQPWPGSGSIRDPARPHPWALSGTEVPEQTL